MSKAVVQIFFSEEQKKKAAAASKNKTNVRIGPLRKAVPSTKIQGTRQSKAKKQPNPKTAKGKVVKSAVRPIQKLAKTVKIIQPKKGAPMQPKPQSQPKTANATKGGGKGKGPMKSTPSADNKDLKNMLKNLRQNEVVSNKPNKPNNYAIALHTAQVIADNGSHPRQKDVYDLLATLQKGWIDQNKFNELLQGILF